MSDEYSLSDLRPGILVEIPADSQTFIIQTEKEKLEFVQTVVEGFEHQVQVAYESGELKV